MADKGSGLGNFFSNAVSGAEHLGSEALHGIGNLFSGGGAVTGSQSAQTAMPNIGSFSQGAMDTVSKALPAAAGGAPGVSAVSALPAFASSGDDLARYFSTGDAGTSGAATGGGGGIGGALGKYGLPTALMFGSEALQQGQNSKQLKAFKGMEEKQQALGDKYRSLADAESGGHLPAGEQLMVQRQLEAARAAIKGKYAELGLNGSEAEQQDLQAANEQAMFQQFQMGQALAQQGYTEAAQGDANATNLMQYIAQSEAAQGTELADVLGKFASMFAGTSPGVA